ncbi:MAG: hypothetical protein H0U74_07915 [Bradymonadaceae bacterium]|nr:hypothetical protein [Lujinxingiaceae bacterium]
MGRSSGRPVAKALALIALFILVCFPLTAAAQSSLLVGAGLFTENSDVEGVERIAVSESERNFDYGSDGFLSASVRYLRASSSSIYLGGGLSYFGTYRALLDQGEDTPDPPNSYEFGPLLEILGQVEWRVGVIEGLDLALGTQLGLALLFPDGDLKAEIKRLESQNVGVWSLPRPGYFVAPLIGARWKLDDRLALRGDLLFKWERIHLLGIDETVDGVPFERTSQSNVLRTEFVFGIEILL